MEPTANLHRILTKALHPIQLAQQLLPTDQTQTREFTSWITEKQEVKTDFVDKIISSDEAHFYLDGYVNRNVFGVQKIHT